MILVYLCVISSVTCDMSVHRVYVSRKSRSDSPPIETGFMYNQVNDNPGMLSMFGSTTDEPVLESYSLIKHLTPIQYHPIDFSKQIYHPYYESSLSKRDLDYATAKARSEYAQYLPSTIKSNIMYERLKSAMYYPTDQESISRYDSDEYQADDDDVRTSSRGVYDNWPYYHHNHEYDHLNIDAKVEKAKDKRYAADAAKVIPIHEDLTDDIPNSYEPYFTTGYYHATTTDNPMKGHDPFFSFTLNDYFDKNVDGDHITFKGLDWGKEFDNSKQLTDFDESSESNRPHSSQSSYHEPDKYDRSDHQKYDLKSTHGDSVTENGFADKYVFDKHDKGDNGKVNEEINYRQNEKNNSGFKDFVDHFANKFGSENHNKDSKYILRRNQDNGEKRKGFHRVYHKNEYQEDKEFYNNNNNSAITEDKGHSDTSIGGSEGLLSSHGSMATADQSNSFNKSGDAENNRFENNHEGYEKSNGFDRNFNKYRDVAKKAAQSNGADYSDHYRIY